MFTQEVPRSTSAGATANGLVLLIGIVFLGVASGAGMYQWQKPRADAAKAERLSQAMSTGAGRVLEWHKYGGPQIHHRLTNVARFSDEQPWLVTFAVESPDGGDPIAWGVDLPMLSRDLASVDNMTVVIELPAPRALGPIVVRGATKNHVPVYSEPSSENDAAARLTDLAFWFLEGLPVALEKDIEGSSLKIRVLPRDAD